LVQSVRPRRDDRLRPPPLDAVHQRLLVVPLVADHHLGRVGGQQRLRLTDVRLLAGRQHHLDGVAQTVHARVHLGAEPAPAAAEGLLLLTTGPVRFFFAPAADGWARTTVESRIITSRWGSRKTAASGSQRPA
jgi:hypothetical protein